MKTTVVRYQAKPERADENQRLIEALFAELNGREPVAPVFDNLNPCLWTGESAHPADAQA